MVEAPATVPEHRPRVHWILRQNRRQRSFFYALLAVVFGLHLLDVQAAPWTWGLMLAHFFAYPHLVYWFAARQADAAQQRDAELRNMVLDVALYTLWIIGLGFPLWPGFILAIAASMSMVAYRGLRGLGYVALGLLAGLALGIPVFQPLPWQPQTSSLVTTLCMALLTVFLLMYAQDAFVRSLGLYQSRQQTRKQLEEIRMLQARLQDAVMRDPLTGLHNRRCLSDLLPSALARCRRQGLPLTLVMVDIDHFKRINDEHGHLGGDAVLRQLGRLLLAHVREGDLVCRMGGEEFLVVLENVGIQPASQRAEALRLAFAGLVVAHEDQAIRTTMSCGLASFPAHGGDIQTLLREADLALYDAKDGGRNQLRVARDTVPQV